MRSVVLLSLALAFGYWAVLSPAQSAGPNAHAACGVERDRSVGFGKVKFADLADVAILGFRWRELLACPKALADDW